MLERVCVCIKFDYFAHARKSDESQMDGNAI